MCLKPYMATTVDRIDQMITTVIIAHVEWQRTLNRNASKRWLKGPEEMQGDEVGSCFCPPGGGRGR